MSEPESDRPAVDLKEAREVAVAAARVAGDIQRKQYGHAPGLRLKGRIDLVTDVDLACERAVVGALLGRFPDHRIQAEEEGDRGADHPCRWIIDPLDATTNFAHGLPFFSVSIGLEVDGELTLGVVYGPMFDELFVADQHAADLIQDGAGGGNEVGDGQAIGRLKVGLGRGRVGGSSHAFSLSLSLSLSAKGASGDLLATVRVVLPERADDELQDLMKKLRDKKPYDPRKDLG